MLVLGLLFGMPGYGDPESNREHGEGRPDIRVEPACVELACCEGFTFGGRPASGDCLVFGDHPASGACPLVTVGLKFDQGASGERLAALVRAVLQQIADRAYDEGGPFGEVPGRVRWGIAMDEGRTIAARAELLG